MSGQSETVLTQAEAAWLVRRFPSYDASDPFIGPLMRKLRRLAGLPMPEREGFPPLLPRDE